MVEGNGRVITVSIKCTRSVDTKAVAECQCARALACACVRVRV